MPEKKEPTTSRLLKPLGWILGGLSVMQLLKDLTPLEIYGLLNEWMLAYAGFVATVSDFLFGWIDWRWMNISAIDAHILVLAIVFTSALARASTEAQVRNGMTVLDAMTGAWRAAAVIVLLPVLLLCALIPSPYDAYVAGVGLAFLAFMFGFAFKEQDVAVPASSVVRRELVGVGAVVLLLVVVNYTFFR